VGRRRAVLLPDPHSRARSLPPERSGFGLVLDCPTGSGGRHALAIAETWAGYASRGSIFQAGALATSGVEPGGALRVENRSQILATHER